MSDDKPRHPLYSAAMREADKFATDGIEQCIALYGKMVDRLALVIPLMELALNNRALDLNNPAHFDRANKINIVMAARVFLGAFMTTTMALRDPARPREEVAEIIAEVMMMAVLDMMKTAKSLDDADRANPNKTDFADAQASEESQERRWAAMGLTEKDRKQAEEYLANARPHTVKPDPDKPDPLVDKHRDAVERQLRGLWNDLADKFAKKGMKSVADELAKRGEGKK